MVDRAKKISELATATSFVNTDLFVVVTNASGNGITKHITANNLRNTLVLTANSTVNGVIRVGSGLSINATAHLSVNTSALVIGNTSTAGILGVGSGLVANATGFLSVNIAALSTGNTTSVGVIGVGSGLSVNATGFVSVNNATINTQALSLGNTTSVGVVGVGNGLTVNATGFVSVNGSQINTATFSRTLEDGYFIGPAANKFILTANGTAAYRFSSYGSDNPTLYVISGHIYAFDLTNIAAHPFKLLDSSNTVLNQDIQHISNTNAITLGVGAQAKTNGVLYWQVPVGATGPYHYQCDSHSGMYGDIVIKDITAI